MSRFLRLYNTFTKELNKVQIAGKYISPATSATRLSYGSFYICGPTVYSHSHLGHALTYIRADLFRRFLKSLFNLRLYTVMNITDVDDKILERTNTEYGCRHLDSSIEPAEHLFNKISDKYYNSFLTDMDSLRVIPADLYVKVSKHMQLVVDYIRELERKKHAYIATNGDIYFSVSSVQNYRGRLDDRKVGVDAFKQDQRDFALWKSAKSGEPVWFYVNSTGDKRIPGRPGWHVQCSAISNAVFGNKLDFHFGGKDLIFPHHYNEEACCCAYNQLDTSETLHVWAQNWLHSGHLIFRDLKMSKSLGNVVAIKDFINSSSVNTLRLLCVYSHYRSDLEFNEDLIEKIKTVDHRLNAFASYLNTEIRKAQDDIAVMEELNVDNDIQNALHSTHEEILEGVCDDFHLDKGLESILNLSKLVYSKDTRSIKPQDLIAVRCLLEDWCNTCGLEYGLVQTSSKEEALLELVSSYRQKVRRLVLNEIKGMRTQSGANKSGLEELLKECDDLRTRLDELGFIFRDHKS